MPYEIRWEAPKGVLKRHFGEVSGQEVLEAVVETEANARFDDLRWVINDFLDCTHLEMLTQEVDVVAAIDKAAAIVNPRIRVAIVATHPQVLAAARQYASSPMNAYETRIFETMQEARDWVQSPRSAV